MTNIISISKLKPESFFRKAIETLKKEGQEVSKVLPNGTKIKYVRGANFETRGFGDKYTLYKEVTRPDNTRYVTNANIIRDEVYVNEIFCIKPDDFEKLPNYTTYASYVYSMSPGFSNIPVVSTFNSYRRYPEQLKKLLTKSSPESCTKFGDYIHTKGNNIPKVKVESTKEQPKIKGDFSVPENLPEPKQKLEIPENITETKIEKFDDVVIEDGYVSPYQCPGAKPEIIQNLQEKPPFTKPNIDDVVFD